MKIRTLVFGYLVINFISACFQFNFIVAKLGEWLSLISQIHHAYISIVLTYIQN